VLQHGWIVPELVLVVEPDVATASRIVDELHDAGLRTALCTNPSQAVLLAHEVHPDVIVADFTAEAANGDGLLNDRWTIGNASPVIVLHSPDGAPERVRMLHQNADDWLETPFDVEELVARVEAILRRKRTAWPPNDSQAATSDFSSETGSAGTVITPIGLYSAVDFHARLGYEVRRAKRYARPLALLVMSLDYFHEYSAHYGHRARQNALRQVGELIRRSVRSADLPARLGRSEFAVLLPEVSAEYAKVPAERVRSNVRRLAIEHMQFATASVGVSVLLANDNAQALLHRAKAAMETSARRGGDSSTVLLEALSN
jgi:diguanylate cyclase (GGDEF)-like protein